MPREIVDEKDVVVSREDEDDDYLYEEEYSPEDDGQDCGRWLGGKLLHQCSKAGSEECDWSCPIGLQHRISR